MEIASSLIEQKNVHLPWVGKITFKLLLGGENFTAACCRLVTLTRSCWQTRWWKCSSLGRDRGLGGLPQTWIEEDRGNVSKCVCVLGGGGAHTE